MKKAALKELLDSLTLDEKILQLLQLTGGFFGSGEQVLTGPAARLGLRPDQTAKAGSVLSCVGAERTEEVQAISRKHGKIPLLFMADVINGYRTILPIPLAQGCSFDEELVRQGAEMAAREAAWAGIHCVFSPMVDLVRDARWGRCMESTGEDVYLNGRMAEAMVRGYQGTDLKNGETVAACVKHFAAYGAPTAGREYTGAELSKQTLRQDYLPAYAAAVRAGAALVMAAFNGVNGRPCTANTHLLRDMLRQEMGFDGVVISDWGAVEELVKIGVAEDPLDAARQAFQAGVDVEMMTACYAHGLKALLDRGEISMDQLDRAVLRVLELKNKLGLFEDSVRGRNVEKDTAPLQPDHRELARQMVRESAVLLENRDHILPLPKHGKKILLLGPYGNTKVLNGSWSIFADTGDNVPLSDALREAGADVTVAPGCPLLDPGTRFPGRKAMILEETTPETAENWQREAAVLAKEADVVLLALGEHPEQSGEAASRTDLTLPQVQLDLLEAVRSVNENLVTLIFCGRPLELEPVTRKSKALLLAWLPGTEGGHGLADLLFGDVCPSGKLSMSFPRRAAQEPIWYSDARNGRQRTEFPSVRYVSGYLDCPDTPLYPFGYGLSYTDFAYGPVSVRGNCVEASVKNIGKRAGWETVQLYVQDVTAQVIRPLRELKGFRRIFLHPGEEMIVSFLITEELLAYVHPDGKRYADPGEFRFWLGGDSRKENGCSWHWKGEECGLSQRITGK